VVSVNLKHFVYKFLLTKGEEELDKCRVKKSPDISVCFVKISKSWSMELPKFIGKLNEFSTSPKIQRD